MAQGLITTAQFPMANPAASLAQGLAQGMQLGAQRRQLALQEAEQQRLVQKQQAEADKLQFEREVEANKRKEINKVLFTEGLDDRTRFDQLSAIDPDYAKSYVEGVAKIGNMRDEEASTLKKQNDLVSTAALQFGDLLKKNPEQANAVLGHSIQQLNGIGADTTELLEILRLSSNGDLKGASTLAGTVFSKGVANDTILKERVAYSVREVTLPDGTPALLKIFPDHTEFVKDEEGKRVLPEIKSSKSISIGKNGEVIITEGPGAGAGVRTDAVGNTQATVNMLQKDLTDNEKFLDNLKSVALKYHPDYHTWRGRGYDYYLSVKEKAGVDLTPEEARYVRNFEDYSMLVSQMFNDYRQSITGAAASDAEIERLKKDFLNIGKSPTAAMAAIEQLREKTLRGNRLIRGILREGFKGDRDELVKALKLKKSWEDDDPEVRFNELLRTKLQTFNSSNGRGPNQEELLLLQREVATQVRNEGYKPK